MFEEVKRSCPQKQVSLPQGTPYFKDQTEILKQTKGCFPEGRWGGLSFLAEGNVGRTIQQNSYLQGLLMQFCDRMGLVGRKEKTVRGKQELAQQIMIQNHTLEFAGLASRSSSFHMTRRPPSHRPFWISQQRSGGIAGPSLTSPPQLTAKNHPPITQNCTVQHGSPMWLVSTWLI